MGLILNEEGTFGHNPGLAWLMGTYFFLLEPTIGCKLPAFWLGAAAITLIVSFFGFLISRWPRRSPLDISLSCIVSR